ncbi:putative methyltransferase [Kitasatospora cheerisanensis KCTC 2395]|uniref:Putative methyltransferase n=1 Tax=Kitasatospora cheerisanensis KCTC 2395 TaxID=1348663 RepID=A0A066Z1H0_9ACTN|nr:putative methyltransferase [Kitasatospora cheerisanensis KCTC 2395]
MRRVLAPGGRLLLGFFAADPGLGDTDRPVPFDHKVTTAHRWPVDTLTALLRTAGPPRDRPAASAAPALANASRRRRSWPKRHPERPRPLAQRRPRGAAD